MVRILFIWILTLPVLIGQQDWVIQTNANFDQNSFSNTFKSKTHNISALDQHNQYYRVNGHIVKEDLIRQKNIVSFMRNADIDYRLVPNDALYNESQWNLDLIQAPEAWNETTGGETYDGRDIVIAVIDDGYQTLHPDLIPNLWTNSGEIPNDGIDNDQNGYVDDHKGYNVETNNDKHAIANHGTQVTGIMGAKGNNQIGISGINWNVKLMLISGVSNASEIVEAYNYIHTMRKRYNDTNGNAGAFVVVSNFSGGISNVFAEDFQIWCDLYNDLGDEGIVSVTAVDNREVDVESNGDMPTLCTSPYLITVTNTNALDVKVRNSAFGEISVDIGAPGENVTTTESDNEYGIISGTSASCPHVAACAALLYASNCETLIELSMNNPSTATNLIRDVILNSAVPVNTLAGVTTSGGRVDLFEAMKTLALSCSDTELGQLTIENVNVQDTKIQVDYSISSLDDHTFAVFDMQGRKVYDFQFTPSLFGQNNLEFDLIGVPQGLYILTLKNQDNITAKQLVVF